jgi:hypothetical protein
MDGQGYPLRRLPDGSGVETAPTHCPNGHALRHPNVLCSYGPNPHRQAMAKWMCWGCRSVIWQDGSVKLGELA